MIGLSGAGGLQDTGVTGMASNEMVLEEYERCIVKLLKNGSTAGAGLVLAPGRILTCAHVVGRKNGQTTELDIDARLEVEFYGVTAAGRTMDPLLVTPDTDLWNSGLPSDLAILNWYADEKLPDGVRPAQFCVRPNQKETVIFCRGFPCSDFDTYTAKGCVTGDASLKGQPVWQLDANSIFSGFSGGPIFNAHSGDVIGITRCIKRPEDGLRCIDDACGIPVKLIAEFCKPILGDIFNDRGRAAVQSLRDNVERILNDVQELQNALLRELSLPPHQAPSGARGLADYLLGPSMSLTQFVDVACRCWDDLSGTSKPPKRQLDAAAKLYTLVVSGVLDRELVERLRADLQKGKRFQIVPFSNRGIIALLTAGADGRLGTYRKKTSAGLWKDLPMGAHEIELPADKGITRSGTLVRRELDRVIAEGLGQSLDSFPADPRVYLDAALRERETSGKRLFLIVDTDTPGSQKEVVKEMQQRYPHLTVLTALQPVDEEQRQAIAMTPWINKKLLPYWK